jgi:hypothetical protein
MTFKEYCEVLDDRFSHLRQRYSDRNPLGETFDWDINWTMKTMRKASGFIEDIHTNLLKKGLSDDEAFAQVIEDLRAYVWLDEVVLAECANEMALVKLDRLREVLIKGAADREVPSLYDMDV